ncbi:MAG: hypothetical protein G8345_04725 [Magnetococcales bacterium]|nr:hypothetical protein [Magnetococcales bacterium]NGZ26175.1 hypothetical protein [Magnetococcales bacterium]
MSEEKTPIDETFKRNVISFSTMLARLPANVVERPFRGELAVMEVMRLIKSIHSLQAKVVVIRPQGSEVLDQLEASPNGTGLVINGQLITVEWVIFHRSGLIAFDHILCCGEMAGGKVVVLLAADLSPLMDSNALRLLGRHATLMSQSAEAAQEYFKELEGVATMIRSGKQGLPFGMEG